MKDRPDVSCTCTGRSPWPEMSRLLGPGPDRFYVCPECDRVREQVCRPDGTIIREVWHTGTDPTLPAWVQTQLDDRRPLDQLSLF